jgi:hypothetical protein
MQEIYMVELSRQQMETLVTALDIAGAWHKQNRHFETVKRIIKDKMNLKES